MTRLMTKLAMVAAGMLILAKTANTVPPLAALRLRKPDRQEAGLRDRLRDSGASIMRERVFWSMSRRA
jgi:hypothetical protein